VRERERSKERKTKTQPKGNREKECERKRKRNKERDYTRARACAHVRAKTNHRVGATKPTKRGFWNTIAEIRKFLDRLRESSRRKRGWRGKGLGEEGSSSAGGREGGGKTKECAKKRVKEMEKEKEKTGGSRMRTEDTEVACR